MRQEEQHVNLSDHLEQNVDGRHSVEVLDEFTSVDDGKELLFEGHDQKLIEECEMGGGTQRNQQHRGSMG